MIIEIENFLPKTLQDHFESHLLSSNFPWYFVKDVTKENVIEGEYYKSGFHHTPFINDSPKSVEYDQVLFLPHYIRSILNKENLILSRIRYGMNTKSSETILHNNPHIDFAEGFPHKHYTALYYVNDCDGDTFIFNETKKSKDYTIKKRISPAKGKLCIFDGEHYHASSPPNIFDYRIVITVNLYEPT